MTQRVLTPHELLQQLKAGNAVFADVLAFIDAHFEFTPTAFKNGETYNEVGQNAGSCRVFSFAQIENLTQEETLTLFAEHYQSVLATPEGIDHQNIRQFQQHGWQGIVFNGHALKRKS